MIAAVVFSPLALILIIILVLLIVGPRTYYRSYAGPPADWLWFLVALVVVLWLLGII